MQRRRRAWRAVWDGRDGRPRRVMREWSLRKKATVVAVVLALGVGLVGARFASGKTLLGFTVVCDASGAMEPTVRPGECILVAPFRTLSRGDIVAYRTERRELVRASRIVAVPRERVRLRDGAFKLDNVSLPGGCSDRPSAFGSRLEPVEALPPQDALTRWRQTNSMTGREVWPCGVSHPVYFRDGGEQWRRHDLDVQLGPEVFVVAPDNRDDGGPLLLGGSAIVGRAWIVIRTPFENRLLQALD